ncbi:hypothetical protein R1flu_002404 [Riccia fluitans]|uniref:Uncharacterized protein n=1 Tax=Riccia fluitans TaxID=41844 RepID=A0ABD1Y615_9MARC
MQLQLDQNISSKHPPRPEVKTFGAFFQHRTVFSVSTNHVCQSDFLYESRQKTHEPLIPTSNKQSWDSTWKTGREEVSKSSSVVEDFEVTCNTLGPEISSPISVRILTKI